jgi:glycolate oxidase FAD binding subunit
MKAPTSTSLQRVEEIVGSVNSSYAAQELAARRVDGLQPAIVVRPETVEQICEILRVAATEQLAVIPSGGASKLGIGNPPDRYDVALDLSRMNRVLAYDPQDLTLGVEPGVRIEDLLQILGEKRQFLPIHVPFSGQATIGGTVAANSSSLLRHGYGGLRDFCLGMEFVTGQGAASKAGGRVVKNVTGYDLHKALIGSLGTLAVITRINFRTYPLPEARGTTVATFADAESAFGFCRDLAQSVLTPQVLEVADPGAAHFMFPGSSDRTSWRVILTAAGSPAIVARHADEASRMAGSAKATSVASTSEAEQLELLARVQEFPSMVLRAAPAAAIFRISLVPTLMPLLAKRLSELANTRQLNFAALTRASGILYAAFASESDGAEKTSSMAAAGGEVFGICHEYGRDCSAMLEWAPVEMKRALGDVWGPPRPDFALMKRVKNVFDPQGILSPGRFAGGS